MAIVSGDSLGVASDEDADEYQAGQRGDLGNGEDVLYQSAGAHTEDVDDRQQNDDDDAAQVLRVQPHIHVAKYHRAERDGRHLIDVNDPVRGIYGRKEHAHELTEGHADRSNSAGLDNGEQGPAIKKAPDGAE